jgi:hypothetical protein
MQFYELKWLQLLWFIPFLGLLYRFVFARKRTLLQAFGHPNTMREMMRSHNARTPLWKALWFLVGFTFLSLALAQPQCR